MTKNIINWALAAAVITGWMALAAHFDQQRFEGDSRHQDSMSADLRFARAAQQICGENAVWRETDQRGQIVCISKHGKAGKKVQVSL